MVGFDLLGLVKVGGIFAVGAIVFAESGLLIGFFLPGDSLLFTAGLLASQGYFSLPLLIAVCCVAAIVGDSAGYAIGARMGTRLFRNEQARFLKPHYVEQTKAFYAKHGNKTIVLARFVPIVRTLAPALAGVGQMPYRTFLAYNIIGGVLWGAGMPILGYILGQSIPNVDKYILPIVALIIVVSVIPPALEWWRERR